MLIGPPQLLPGDGAVTSPRSIDHSPRRNNRPVRGDDTPPMSRSHCTNSSLARRYDNSLDYNDYDPCAREKHDAESKFGQSTGSGFTFLTDDTQPTSVSSNGSSEASRGAPSRSFTDQLMKKLQSRGRVPSVSADSPMRQLPSLPGESDAPPPPHHHCLRTVTDQAGHRHRDLHSIPR
jgi:cytokinesis protein